MKNIAIPLICLGCICLGLAIRLFYNQWKASKAGKTVKRIKWENFGKPKWKKRH
jgi:hypothetical protein